LLDVCLGQRERLEDWLEMGRGLIRRGLRSPWLVVGDGAPGLHRAIMELWLDADRKRCTVHKLRNVLARLPKKSPAIERVKQACWAALDEASSAEDAERRLRGLEGELERQYPSAAACLAEDLPALWVHLHYPGRLRVRLRGANLPERSLGEIKRRTRVIGRFPGETSCLSLCWAVLDLVIAGARGLGLTALDQREIEHVRLERLRQTPVERTA
jgi:transposase-like protein